MLYCAAAATFIDLARIGVRIKADGWEGATARTSAQGNYEFAALRTGRYDVEVFFPDFYVAMTSTRYDKISVFGDRPTLVSGVDFGLAPRQAAGEPPSALPETGASWGFVQRVLSWLSALFRH